MSTIVITGHRPNKLPFGYAKPKDNPFFQAMCTWMQENILQLKATTCISGFALGVDLAFALVAIKNKIPLHAYIPCLNQECKWPKESQEIYKKLLGKCEKIVYATKEAYTNECMQRRNEMMCDQLLLPEDRLLAIFDETRGGTANCVRYAESQDKTIIKIKPIEICEKYGIKLQM